MTKGERKTRQARKQRSDVVRSILEKLEKAMTVENADVKASMADYIRLIQLLKELEAEADEPAEIKVTWVEPPEEKVETTTEKEKNGSNT